MIKQVSIYGAVGAGVTVIDLSLFLILTYAFHMGPVASNALGWCVTLPIAYFLHSTFSFRVSPSAAGFLGFVGVSIATLLVGTIVIGLLTIVTSAAVAKIAAIGTTFVTGYLLSRSLVFRKLAARC